MTFFAPRVVLADPAVLLKKAEKHYEALEYEQALRALIAVQADKTATPIQRARAFLYMGVCFTALGNTKNGVLAFMEVLKIRPRFRLPPGVSPSIRATFEAALKQLKMSATPPPPQAKGPAAGGGHGPGKPGPVAELDVTGPRSIAAGKPVKLEIETANPQRRIRRVVIRWRRIGGDDYSTIKLKPKRRSTINVTGVIPGALIGTTKGTLAYYIEARDSGGKAIATYGTQDDPRRIDLTEAEGGGSTWAWWVVGITGAAAAIAGGVVAAVLLTNNSGGGVSPNEASVVVTIR